MPLPITVVRLLLFTAWASLSLARQVVFGDGNPWLRDLRVGQVNFLHTTDTHGWLGSHPSQEDYDADWGDLLSFVEHFRRNRVRPAGADLLLIDTGDKLDGTALSDATRYPGEKSTTLFNELDYDLLTLGNHELYTAERAEREYFDTAIASKFRDKYVASNVVFVPSDGSEPRPFGNKYVYLETPVNKIRCLALSFMFSFDRSNARARVVPPEVEVQKQWMQDLAAKYTSDNLDLLIVFGHLPATDPEYHEIDTLHRHLRDLFPDLTIQYFGGHSHVRDFVELDSRATCLQSGRFAETVGFVSIDNVTATDPVFSRLYIDFNKRSFMHHARVKDLYTKRGAALSHRIETLSDDLKLQKQYGVVPQSYYMLTRPLESPENIYNLIRAHILPSLNPHCDKKRFVMLNTGAVRFDLYKGPFTKGTEFSVLPFPNTWRYIKLPFRIASQLETYLNNEPTVKVLSPPGSNVSVLKIAQRPDTCPFITDPKLSEGYTTWDDCGCNGDDTQHSSQAMYPIPNVIQYTNTEENTDPDQVVEFVFFSFLANDILNAANDLSGGKGKIYTDKDCFDYPGKSAKRLLRDHIIKISH
ncbi:Smn1p KNAG_0M00220 [Huiozyma naganishii CBS 8797]|uniref:Uncharacterized protein n=1 Tax=Huiozyma naganishii (strain ATCC MYA-139 / BCRC 22969 / CBS 8797 / KCTC 17520 / NBRC 10181 / NCYC 3082 / Yp74L-3) TaxID=1071383 RepID=J7RDB0_HUIN7|nr:hypothetical protein KNAG_0M00220 [Kazachstania naganishii CBS 8797]CCK72875.1 hypothetical protein KNAG_0M00220 [Kazachstania naganishii CBS 8797]